MMECCLFSCAITCTCFTNTPYGSITANITPSILSLSHPPPLPRCIPSHSLTKCTHPSQSFPPHCHFIVHTTTTPSFLLHRRTPSTLFHLILPPLFFSTGERRDINTEKYWRHEFPSLMNSREVIKYIVLSVEPILNTTSMRPSNKKRGSGADRKVRLAEVIVARERDFGINDHQYTCTTHLGNILREGDVVLGYDLVAASWTKDLEASKILVCVPYPL